MKHFHTSDGIKLAYQDAGSGPVVLCLSGLTRNSTDFDYVAPHLTGIRLIRLDYRGRGQSDWADYTSYTVEREARDVVELLDHLNVERAAILGTSRGGLIAMVLAAIAKTRLSGVCLNDIGPELDPNGLKFIMTYLGRRPAQKNHDDAARARADYMTGFRNVPMSRWHDEVQKFFPLTKRGLGIDYDPKLRRAVEESAKDPTPDLWPLFDCLRDLPLALIRGENSDLLMRGTATEMQNRRPDMLFANVPDRGHVPFLDEIESLDILRKFMDQIT